jgi:hypothetical protein
VGYFLAEPLIIVMRYGLLPACLDMSHQRPPVYTEKERLAIELIHREEERVKALEAEAETEGQGGVTKRKGGVVSFLTDGAILSNSLDMMTELVESIA